MVPAKAQTFCLLSLCLIAGLGTAIYANSLHNAFHFDDMFFIVEKPEIRDIKDTTAIWHAHSHPARFVAFYTFALNYHWDRYDVVGYHIFNTAVHVINGLLVWGMVMLLLSTPRMRGHPLGEHARWLALLTALVFVAHPLQTQAVTYISQRFASLATLFYLLTAVLYLLGRRARAVPAAVCFIAAAVSALLGMFTKQITFTLPLTLILMEAAFLREGRTRWRTIGVIALFLLVVPGIFSFKPGILNIQHVSESHEGDPLTPRSYFFTQMPVLWTYIRLFFLPYGQNLDYDFPTFYHFFDPPVIAGFAGLTLLFVTGCWALRRHPLVGFGILWFFITISVESTFITIKNVIFEHRMYLPMAGVALAAVTALWTYTRRPWAVRTAVLIWVAALSVLTVQRNLVWRDGISLWTDVVRKSPHKSRPYTSLGIAYLQRDQPAEALDNLDTAISLNPQAYKAVGNRGLALTKLGRLDEALRDYNRALDLKPGSAITFNNRGDLYRRLGKDDLALQDYDRAISLRPAYAQAYVNRGVLYGQSGQPELALADFTRAIALNPTLYEPYNNRGIVYQQKGLFPLALADFDRALQRKADYADALYNRGNVYRDMRNIEAAMKDYAAALKIRYNYSQVYNNRGIIYGGRGRRELALEDFNKAIDYDPDYSSAYFNRSLVYMQTGDYERALADVRKARELGKDVHEVYIQQIQSLIKQRGKATDHE
ncbi:MAG: tetratricopeptide repeat protein [Candidatus Omnitrophica bacterium]|nr:tetratricopeptide repeat protein [Candidatus Omnitrophota bacterium]MCB9721505.1 tetratricopeptide repeat protein [Candidatus Omnitrophota bacterium]